MRERAHEGQEPDHVRGRSLTLVAALGVPLFAAGFASRWEPLLSAQTSNVELAVFCALGGWLAVTARALRLQTAGSSLPPWMRLPGVLSKLSLALAFSYIGWCLMQTWGVGVGPVWPTPPDGAPPNMARLWFFQQSLLLLLPALMTGALAMPIAGLLLTLFIRGTGLRAGASAYVVGAVSAAVAWLGITSQPAIHAAQTVSATIEAHPAAPALIGVALMLGALLPGRRRS